MFPKFKRYLILVIYASCICGLLFVIFNRSTVVPKQYKKQIQHTKKTLFNSSELTIKIKNAYPEEEQEKSTENVEIQASQCKIPKLEMNNSEVMSVYAKATPLNCKKYEENWVFIDEKDRIQVTDYAKNKFGTESIKCNTSYFHQVSDKELKFEALGVVPFGYELNKSDFKKVNCSANNETKAHVFMNIIPREDIIKKAETIKRPSSWSGLSVYWFSFDSISQMAFRRLLPKTINYLEKELGAITLNGYNIVGDGTPQAFIPILTGKTELELPLTRKRYKNANFVDIYPFIWKNFSEAGYITAYGEDAAQVGTFTYRLKGFKEQPTHHYSRTFFQESEKVFKSGQCFGSENSFDAWARYCKEFLTKYPKNIPKFGIFHHSAFTHDSVNDLQNLDESIHLHFKELFNGGFLDNTVVFIGADHGHRFSALRETQQGQLEERLPMMSIILPEAFRKSDKGINVYQNLKDNANRLTSPFDIYSTFLDILYLPADLSTVQNTSSRSLSLFRPISESRSCAEAGIEPHWCTCLQWKNSSEELSTKLAKGVADAINEYTESERELCAPLQPNKLLKYAMLVPHEKVLHYSGVKDKDGFIPQFKGKANNTAAIYALTFTTTPGEAKYEATVQYDSKSNILTVDMLAISHVNKYGDTPHCIIDKNYFMATYCVCYDKI